MTEGKKDAPDLGAALARARALAPTIGKATDRLNTALAQAEKALIELQLGVTASVDLPDSDPFGLSYRQLRFGKLDKEWHLLLVHGRESDDTESLTPIVNASREARVEAVAHLPRLVAELTSQAEKVLQTVAGAAASAETIALTIAGKGAAK